jgi:hypothetical protein
MFAIVEVAQSITALRTKATMTTGAVSMLEVGGGGYYFSGCQIVRNK